MKIVLLKSRLSYRGGLEKITLRLATRFADKGCEVIILTTYDKKPTPKIKNVKIVPLRKTSKFTLFHLIFFHRDCKRWLKENPASIVFDMERGAPATHLRAGNGVHAAFLKQKFLTLSFFKKCTIIFNPLHVYILRSEKKSAESPRLKTLFTNSFMVKKEMLNYFYIDPDKIEVVHNGVEWKEWDKPFRESLERKKQGCFKFLFIGNDYKRKGLTFLLKGLSLIKNEKFHLDVIGKEKNLSFFKNLTNELDLTDKVTFHGVKENLISFYQEADCLTIPSLYDPFANVTLEGLAMGLFVVTSKFNGAKEILHKNSGVEIKDLLNPESVKEALMIALNHPKTIASSLQIRNQIKELDFSTQLDKIVSKTLADNV